MMGVMTAFNPCQMGATARLAWKAAEVGQMGFALGGAVGAAATAWQSGNPLDWLQGGVSGDFATRTVGSTPSALSRACFAAGTPIRTPEGWTSIEALQPGDLVLSRDENDPQGRIEAKVVEETFQRTGRVWLLRMEGGQVIRTTPEHPFFPLRTMDWTPAAELQTGDVLRGETGDIHVEAIEDTGEYATVYNCRVAD
jgi:hypothetical protein